MTRDDFGTFTDMLQGLADLYGKTLTQFSIGIYFKALASHDLKVISDAFSRHVQNPDTGQFMPKPADVIKMMQGSSQDNAYRAWSMVEQSIRSIGSYISVVFDDPLIHRTINELGGWVKLCQTLEKDLPFVANDFEKIYKGYRSRNDLPKYPRVLLGIHEAENRQQGFRALPPMLIGNQEKAQIVMEQGISKPILIFKRASEHDIQAISAVVA